MKLLMKWCLAVPVTLIIIGYGLAEDDAAAIRSQILCPVMFVGEIGCTSLQKEIFTDYIGKRIYFCSNGCLEIFKGNPEKYLKRLQEKDLTMMPQLRITG
jgi:YHS domain-containing protein